MARYQAFDELDDAPKQTRSSKPRRRRGSVIGFLAVLVGIAAVAVAKRDALGLWMSNKGIPHGNYLYQVGDYPIEPYQVAAVGVGLAAVALLLRRMTGRTRAGWPVLAILLSAGAAGTYRYDTSPREPGSPERWVQDNVVDRVDAMIHRKDPAPPVSPATPPAPSSVETAAPAPSPATVDKKATSKLFPD